MLIFTISTMFATGLGQSLIFLLIATVGFILNRKSKQIHVLVNSRLDEALGRIKLLETALGIAKGDPIPAPENVVVNGTLAQEPENVVANGT